MSTTEKALGAIRQIGECIYDHGAGKHRGPVSKQQRDQANDGLLLVEIEIRRQHGEIEGLRAQVEALTCRGCHGTGVDGDVGDDGRVVDIQCSDCAGTGLAAPQPKAAQPNEPTENQIQAAFENWLAEKCPSGDDEAVHRQWEASSDYAELYGLAQQAQAKPQEPERGLAEENNRLRAQVEALQQDKLTGFRIATELTLETQTVEEMAADLVRQVKDARAQVEALSKPKEFATLVRDVAADLGVKSLDVCAAIKELGLGDFSINMEVSKEIESKLHEHFQQQPQPHPAVPDIEAAAKALAEVMDYPWEHMPEQGRAQMRKNAEAVLKAAAPQPEAAQKGGA